MKFITDPPKPDLLINTGVVFNRKLIAIRRFEVKDYLNNYFFYYYDLFIKIKTFGLPNGRGWVNEPEHILEAYMILDREIKSIETEQMEELNKGKK